MMKKSRAFTLAELLISLLITGIVMSAVITLFFSVFESYTFHQDISEAKQRGQIALAAISPFISGAALGVPNAPATFQTAFTSPGPTSGVKKTAAALLPVAANKKFNGPVQLASGDVTLSGVVGSDDIVGPELWLVYGVPSGIGVGNDFEVDNTEKPVLLTGTPSSQYFEKNTDTLKSWVVFPASTAPFFVENSTVNPKQWSLAARSNQKISAFDEMHYLRAAKIRVANGSLEVMRLDSAVNTWQPVVEGVVAIEFRFSSGRVLQVTVLARGTERHSKAYMNQIAGWDGPLPADMNYRYAAVTRSWRIRN